MHNANQIEITISQEKYFNQKLCSTWKLWSVQSKANSKKKKNKKLKRVFKRNQHQVTITWNTYQQIEKHKIQ